MNSSSNTPKIYFRLDCGGMIGFGHLSRCLSVADEFSKLGYKPVFVIRKRPSLHELSLRHDVIWLEENSDVLSSDVDTWKVNSEVNEALEFVNATEDGSIVIVDHYSLNKIWQRHLLNLDYRVIIFQDVYNEEFEADVLINYNIGSNDLYKNLDTKINTTFLLSPAYAPLEKKYSENHRFHLNTESQVKSVGIYLGGIGNEHIEKVAQSISEHSYFKNKTIEWVVNNNEEKALVEKNIVNGVVVQGRISSLIDVYLRTQLFIGACGLSFLERSSLGIWHMNFVVADNQNAIGNYIHYNNLGFIAGDLRSQTYEGLLKNWDDLLLITKEKIKNTTENVFKLVDGLGAQRIAFKVLEVVK